MTGAYEELRAGDPGELTIALLRRLGAQVVRTNSFPPPEGYGRWGDDAVDELLADMMSREGEGAAFILHCYLNADDDSSLERLFLASIKNYLIDEAKKTERGKLRRRLDSLMHTDQRFKRLPATATAVPTWRLEGGSAQPWQGDIGLLEDAAWSVRGVQITGWNTSGPTSRDNQHALLTVVFAVLTAAASGVRDEDLARVVEQRFGLLAPPRFTSLDADDAWVDPPAPSADGPAAQVLTAGRAEDIWVSLSQTERSLLPHLGKSNTEIAEVLEVGRKKAAALTAALAEKLRLATIDDDERDDVVGSLLALCTRRP